MGSEQTGHGFVPTQSLWRLIESRISEYERLEVKCILGESIVDQTLELHGEVDYWLDIWEDYHNSTQKVNSSIRLPEPPELRQRLGQEINFFLDTLRERAVKNGQDPMSALNSHNTKVIDYVINANNNSLISPLPSSSVDGRQTPCVQPNLDRIMKAEIVTEDLSDMSDKLNLFTFDQVVQHFRSVLQDEVVQLGEDIITLQRCLDDEADYRSETCQAIASEPTLTELKEERSLLEKDVMKCPVSLPTPPHIGPKSTAISPQKSMDMPSLRPSKIPSSATSRDFAIKTASFSPSSRELLKKNAFTTQNHTKTNTDKKLLQADDKMKSNTNVFETQKRNLLGNDLYLKGAGDIKLKSGDSQNEKGTKISVTTGYYMDRNKPSVINNPNLAHGEAAKITLMKDGSGRQTMHVSSLGNQSLINEKTILVPSPPTNANPRPGTASRFRRMVQDCRDS